jgi:uncharacterized protein involved in cysteine biosynthesis
MELTSINFLSVLVLPVAVFGLFLILIYVLSPLIGKPYYDHLEIKKGVFA